MKKKLLNKISILALLACLFLQSPAQTGFRFRAELDSIPQPGFYTISLGPSLTARLQPGLQDIRIVDMEGRQVPYIIKNEVPVSTTIDLDKLRIVSNKKEADGLTHVVIENTTTHALNQLLLVIKNTEAHRTVTLSGSDNDSNWYVIKENIPLNAAFTEEGDKYTLSLDFPESRYRYFKVSINGKDLLPVNIVAAGTYEQSNTSGKYMRLPAPQLLDKEGKDKCSYVFLRFGDDYFIDRLVLQVTGPKFYKRKMIIDTGSIGSAQQVGEYILQSDTPVVIEPGVKTNHLLLKIQNEDNPPLQVVAANAYQLNKYLYTYLDKGKQYSLVFGDSAATAPVYDLQYFKDSIGNALLPLAYGKIVLNKPAVTEQPVTPKANKALLWLALGTVLVILLLLTAKMTREINKRNP
ncbi:MAG TPA: hypothetical protein VGM41_01290 [Chitinophagaceae bacterium]|jgi:hypothetical protein